MDASSRRGRRGRVLRLPARRRTFSMHTLKAQGAPQPSVPLAPVQAGFPKTQACQMPLPRADLRTAVAIASPFSFPPRPEKHDAAQNRTADPQARCHV